MNFLLEDIGRFVNKTTKYLTMKWDKLVVF